MTTEQAAENHGDEWELTWHFRWGIYTSILTCTHSKNSLAAAEALSLKISSHGLSLKLSHRSSQSAQEQSYAMRWKRASCGKYDEKSMETKTTIWSEFSNQKKVIVKQILVSVERNKSKRAGLWEPQSGMRVVFLLVFLANSCFRSDSC